MAEDTAYALPADFPAPTVYASLMEVAIKEPLDGWATDVTKKIGSVLATFENAGIEHLRKAYVAGVADGYRQALVEMEQNRGKA